MTTRIMLAGLALLATAAQAQGRGGRQGGPASGGMMCLDVNNVSQIELVQGSAAVAEYGHKADNGLAVISPKSGVPLATILTPCAGGSSPQQDDPFNADLFAPSWVMSHQEAIKLSDEQKTFILSRLVSTQTKFAELDVKLRGEMEKLGDLLAPSQVDQANVLASLDRVLVIERDIKRAQVSLMVDVKDKLTNVQQMQLGQMRSASSNEAMSQSACAKGPIYVVDGKTSCTAP